MRSRVMYLAIMLAVCSPLYSQHIHTEPFRSAISGATNPQVIPDTVAYRLFLSALWAPPGTASDPADRLRAIVRPASLSESELQLLPGIVEAFHSHMAKLNAHISALRKGSGTISAADQIDLDAQRDAVVSITRSELANSLSPSSMARLHALIMAEKAHITAFFAPDMSQAAVQK